MKKFNLFFCLFFSLLFFNKLHAQLLTNNSSVLVLNPGASLTVLGEVRSKGTASITNNGTIELTGNWIDSTSAPVFGTSSGNVVFMGNTQSIGGSSSTLFHHLTLSGTPQVSLLVNTTTGGNAATGVLSIGDGVIELNSNTLHVKNPVGSAVTFLNGGIVSEQVDNSSRVLWDIGTATGSHIIPFRTAGGDLIPVNINLTGGNAGTVQASTYLTSPLNQPFPSTPELVTHVRNSSGLDNSNNMVDRFWYLEKSGTTGTASLTFSFSPVEVAGSGNLGPRAQRWSSAGDGWFAVSPGQSNPTALSTLVPGVNVFGTWALANEPTPLPIALLHFDAKANQKGYVDLMWVTAQEINNDYFTIERSRDGSDFTDLLQVDGAGNSSSIIEYNTIDPAPYQGISYYRLRQTDYNGTFTHSQIVPVQFGNNSTTTVSIYPNPVSEYFFVNLSGELAGSGDLHFVLYDAAGRMTTSIVLPNTGSSGSLFRLERNDIAAGVYQYSITGKNGERITGKMVMD